MNLSGVGPAARNTVRWEPEVLAHFLGSQQLVVVQFQAAPLPRNASIDAPRAYCDPSHGDAFNALVFPLAVASSYLLVGS
jgi:hypothetical protein